MRQFAISALALSALLTAVVDTSAQTTPIYRSNFDSGAKPYGFASWDDSREGSYYRQQLVPGGSPSGHAALRITAIPTSVIGDDGWGGAFPGEAVAPPQGAIRYARWRIRYVSPINWRSDSCATPPNCGMNVRTTPDKLFIMGNTCESAPYQPTRIIYWQYAEGPSRSRPLNNFTQNIGPGVGGHFPVPADTWLQVQVKIVSSSSANASDGQLHVWVNNNDESRPTRSGTGIQIKTAGWGRNICPESHIVFGDGSYNPLSDRDPTTNAVQEIADFEYDDQFDPNWAIGLPSRPNNFRVIGMASYLLPFGALGLMLLRRQKGTA